MRKLTIMLIPDGIRGEMRQIKFPAVMLHCGLVLAGIFFVTAFFIVMDYRDLLSIRNDYSKLVKENSSLKGEAKVLIANLEDLKKSLRRIQDYTLKVGDLMQLRVQSVSKQTGIGPLSQEEVSRRDVKGEQVAAVDNQIPFGLNIDKLVFKPVFQKIYALNDGSANQVFELQRLLSTLSQHKTLLNSIPSITPVNGWVTSGFGKRVSPFTGEITLHKGIDVAAPVGTAILAPADGVVVFTGAKEGFGNYIMVAHGYGVVTGYGHNAQNLVQPGQQVSRGEQIATVGQSGRTTGPHVHYEIWVNGNYVNPKRFILDLDDNDLRVF